MSRRRAIGYVRTIRGTEVDEPISDWPRDKSSKFGEDLAGGWLLENGGRVEGLEWGKRIAIPTGGNSTHRTIDWLVGKRIAIEVKTYNRDLGQGGYAGNTHQIEDLALWRDELPNERAIVLARIAWNGNSDVHRLFLADTRHFRIPLIRFLW